MTISVIIPTLNAGASIGMLLSALRSQKTEPSEIIVVDSTSEDDTVARAKSFNAKTMLIPRHAFNHGKTRNLAALEAQGDIIVFMTQDAMPADDSLLSTLTAPLEGSDIAAAFARHMPRSDASPLEVFARRFNYPEQGSVKGLEDLKKYGIKTFFFSNVCSAIKKELFARVGMFPDDVRSNEDMLIAAKFILAGYRIAYVPEATVVHSHNYSLSGLFKRYYNIGSSIKSNKLLLKDVKAEGEGVRFLKEQVLYLAGQRRYLLLPRVLLESLMKYAGYRTGLIVG